MCSECKRLASTPTFVTDATAKVHRKRRVKESLSLQPDFPIPAIVASGRVVILSYEAPIWLLRIVTVPPRRPCFEKSGLRLLGKMTTHIAERDLTSRASRISRTDAFIIESVIRVSSALMPCEPAEAIRGCSCRGEMMRANGSRHYGMEQPESARRVRRAYYRLPLRSGKKQSWPLGPREWPKLRQ